MNYVYLVIVAAVVVKTVNRDLCYMDTEMSPSDYFQESHNKAIDIVVRAACIAIYHRKYISAYWDNI